MMVTKEQVDRVDALYRKLAELSLGYSNGDIVSAAVHLIASLIATADNDDQAATLTERTCVALTVSVLANRRANANKSEVH